MSELRPEHWTTIIVAGLSLVGVLGGGLMAALAGWLKARADRQLAEANLEAQQAVTKQQIDQQIDQRLAAEVERLNGELDDLRSEMGALTAKFSQWKAAVARVFHAIAAQWTGEGGPDIDPDDIAILEDTIPLRWLRRRRSTAPISTIPPKEPSHD